MSRTNVEHLELAYGALNRGDLEAYCELFAREVEVTHARDPTVHRLSRTPAEVSNFLDSYSEFHFELAKVIDAGNRIAVAFRMRAVNKQSGAPTDARWCSVFGFEEDKVVRADGYEALSDAIDALDLQEPVSDDDSTHHRPE